MARRRSPALRSHPVDGGRLSLFKYDRYMDRRAAAGTFAARLPLRLPLSETAACQGDLSMKAKPPFRADHVGSLLRSAQIKEARAKRERGEIDAIALRAVED